VVVRATKASSSLLYIDTQCYLEAVVIRYRSEFILLYPFEIYNKVNKLIEVFP